MKGKPITILLVEDDSAHAEIVRRNLEMLQIPKRLMWVTDGQAALDYLYHVNEYAAPAIAPTPAMILLDLRLPKLDGLEVLRTLKVEPLLKLIPVVVMSTSSAASDIERAYEYHANSYVTKPLDLAQFTATLETLGYYWLRWNELPEVVVA